MTPAAVDEKIARISTILKRYCSIHFDIIRFVDLCVGGYFWIHSIYSRDEADAQIWPNFRSVRFSRWIIFCVDVCSSGILIAPFVGGEYVENFRTFPAIWMIFWWNNGFISFFCAHFVFSILIYEFTVRFVINSFCFLEPTNVQGQFGIKCLLTSSYLIGRADVYRDFF